MKKMKTLLALLAALMMVASVFTGCTKAAPAAAEPATATTETTEAAATEAPAAIPGDLNGDGKVVIGYDNMQETENFFQVVKGSLADAIDARGWDLVYAFAERDPERMIANVDSFLLQGADFIIDFNVVPETGSAQAADLNERASRCFRSTAYMMAHTSLASTTRTLVKPPAKRWSLRSTKNGTDSSITSSTSMMRAQAPKLKSATLVLATF